jgi:hypothetical protein
MSREARRAVLLGLALLSTGQLLAAQDAPPPVQKAREAARANAATAQGRQWMERNSTAAGALLIPILNNCLPEDGDIPTAFSVYVRLSRTGRAHEIVTELDATLGSCMTEGASQAQFPAAPRDDYWIRLNLAASL